MAAILSGPLYNKLTDLGLLTPYGVIDLGQWLIHVKVCPME